MQKNIEKDAVFTDIKSAKGLCKEQVLQSKEKYGENKLPESGKKSFLRKFISNMGDPVIKILICALIVNIIFSFRNSSYVESIGIGVSIFLATFISTMSEYSSQKAFESLSKESENNLCRVRRVNDEGKSCILQVKVSEIVAYDVVLLETGDKIPADGAVISGKVKVDQSSLTGESREFSKKPCGTFKTDTSHEGSVFSGSLVLSGSCEMQVLAVGENTLLGGISREIQSETRESPLKIRLTKLANQISKLGYVMAFLCALAYLLYSFVFSSAFDMSVILMKLKDMRFLFGELLHAFTLGLTVIVMAVPEGLPMMIAVVLSSNIRKMVKDNVLVRKPVGIEAAGSMNILFTDKTGTLTKGKMSVCAAILGDGENIPFSAFKSKAPLAFDMYKTLAKLGESESGANGIMGGNLTDRALSMSVEKEVLDKNITVQSRTLFDSKYKFSAVRISDKNNLTLIKGAPEVILPYVTSYITKDGRIAEFSKLQLEKELKKAAGGGFRILTLAYGSSGISTKESFGKLTLICNVLISDMPRKEARASVESLRRAGVQVVMITGDNKETAVSIAKKCMIVNSNSDLCLTSGELRELSDEKLREIMPKLKVVARALPSDKSRLVKVAMECGLVVGMTGDGVNDAPALRSSDVGFAMGSGTQVAKESGDIIIIDNNLASIVKAVLYGRTIFKSIRKFIVLQLTINVCAAAVTMIGPFIGVKDPVTVTQMLWINIIMDTLGGIAFAGEAPQKSYMEEKPKKRTESIMNRYMANQIGILGAFTVLLSVAFLKSPVIISHFRQMENSICHLTAFFAFFIFAGVFNCFNARTDSLNIFKGLHKNRAFVFIIFLVMSIQIAFIYLGKSVLRTVPLTMAELSYTMTLAFLVFPADFLRKIFVRLSKKKLRY